MIRKFNFTSIFALLSWGAALVPASAALPDGWQDSKGTTKIGADAQSLGKTIAGRQVALRTANVEKTNSEIEPPFNHLPVILLHVVSQNKESAIIELEDTCRSQAGDFPSRLIGQLIIVKGNYNGIGFDTFRLCQRGPIQQGVYYLLLKEEDRSIFQPFSDKGSRAMLSKTCTESGTHAALVGPYFALERPWTSIQACRIETE